MVKALLGCGISALLVLATAAGVSALYRPMSKYGPLTAQRHSSSSSADGSTYCSTQYSDPAALGIQSLYSTLASADCELAGEHNYPQDYCVRNNEEFDFIVVGGGSAGSVVSNRLTEQADWRVLLVEAGGNPTKTSEIPAMFYALQKSDLDWQYQTEPGDDYCLAMEDHRCNWPRGKVLGGSSTINYMLYIRGNAKDYDRWAADGNTGWSYEDVLPYFKKSEDMRAEEVRATSEFSKYHGTGGYLKVESWQNAEVKELGNGPLTEGMKELGYHPNPDCNGKNQTGFVTLQGTLEDGRRCNAAKAFLTPITNRDNLKVSKNSLVTKILIDEKTKTAIGIEFTNKHGRVIKARAKKEVIVSAGAINSPQLLMLSGIGPRRHLEDLGINVISDLPVGQNLQDHLLMNSVIISLNYSKTSEPPEVSMFDFLLKRNSRYSGLGLASFAAFVNTVKGTDYPDIELLLIDFAKNETGGLAGMLSLYGIRQEIQEKYLEVNRDSYMTLVLCSLLRPYSRGHIRLSSTNPKDHPKITAGYFSDRRDLDTFLRTYDIVSQLVQTKALTSMNAKMNEINVTDCKYTFGSKQYRECALRHLTSTTYHYCGSCKMGPASSPDSVVDPQLRVKGVKRLRVVDASIMPSEVSGNINAAVIMIGEKGSDLIKNTWLKNRKN